MPLSLLIGERLEHLPFQRATRQSLRTFQDGVLTFHPYYSRQKVINIALRLGGPTPRQLPSGRLSFCDHFKSLDIKVQTV